MHVAKFILGGFALAISTASAIPPPIKEIFAKRGAPPPTDQAFIDTVLKRHNGYRGQHGAEPLTWDAGLAQGAKTVADRCSWEEPVVMNRFLFPAPGEDYNYDNMSKVGIDAWYKQKKLYTADHDPVLSQYFTQLVWKASNKLGCAWSRPCVSMIDPGFSLKTDSRSLFCDYDPAGNVPGQYEENVSL